MVAGVNASSYRMRVKAGQFPRGTWRDRFALGSLSRNGVSSFSRFERGWAPGDFDTKSAPVYFNTHTYGLVCDFQPMCSSNHHQLTQGISMHSISVVAWLISFGISTCLIWSLFCHCKALYVSIGYQLWVYKRFDFQPSSAFPSCIHLFSQSQLYRFLLYKEP